MRTRPSRRVELRASYHIDRGHQIRRASGVSRMVVMRLAFHTVFVSRLTPSSLRWTLATYLAASMWRVQPESVFNPCQSVAINPKQASVRRRPDGCNVTGVSHGICESINTIQLTLDARHIRDKINVASASKIRV